MIDDVLIPPTRFHSFRAPERAHPFHSLPHLTRPTAHRPLRTVPCSIQYQDRQLPRAAGVGFTTIKHDTQGDAIVIAPVDMGTP